MSETLQSISISLDAAAKELRATLEGIEKAQVALRQVQEHDGTQQTAELEAIWQHLFALSLPVVNMGAYVVDVMSEIGQQIGSKPTAPNQMEWLGGTDVRAQHARHERQQRAAEFLEWLEPILDHVSPRTRTAVTQAIKKSADGQDSQILIKRLTPEIFMQDLQRGDNTGLVANMRGLGPRGLRELRKAMGVDQPSDSPETEDAP